MYNSVLLFLNIGGQEMIFIFMVALFIFGGKKLPEIAHGLGRGIREFKDASENIKRDINDQINDFEKAADRPKTTIPKEIGPANDVNDADKVTHGPLDQPDIDDITHSDEYYQQSYNYEAPDDYTNYNDNSEPVSSDAVENSEGSTSSKTT